MSLEHLFEQLMKRVLWLENHPVAGVKTGTER